ncbi:unnamed protein product [Clonostachys rosea]|uniref:Uncharacterized protein n=1 Tax=Bionectria ochroleuca TaxID=29856 RepID=A0ABY6V5A0_BIOOC|nr:unnamed protein product [Clonostachys rosea]
MAPVRRYLRITKYTVLECRIYLDNPSLVHSWLLNPRDPVLPRVIESVRPWVLPKLREERERSKKKSTKKKAIKDFVVGDGFEVSLFLTETNTRHSILKKHKHFHDRNAPKLRSNANKLIGETNENPVDLNLDEDFQPILQEDDDENAVNLDSIPLPPRSSRSRSKRQRNVTDGDDDQVEPQEAEEPISVIDSDSDTDQPPQKRHRGAEPGKDAETEDDDKKKMAMDVTYEGFAIYGRVLCLVVRKFNRAGETGNKKSGRGSANQASMENWISSTQLPAGEDSL